MMDLINIEQKNLIKFINIDFFWWMCGIFNYINNQ